MEKMDEIVDMCHKTEQDIDIKDEELHDVNSETDSTDEQELEVKDNQVCMFVQTGIVRDEDDAKYSLIMNYTDSQTEEKQYQRIQSDKISLEKVNLKRPNEPFLEEFKLFNHSKHMEMQIKKRRLQCSQYDNISLKAKNVNQPTSIFKHKFSAKMRPIGNVIEKGHITKNMKPFINNDHRKLHTITHTGGIPYQCSHCVKSFIDERHFKEHMWIHIENSRVITDFSYYKRPNICNHCTAFHTNPSSYKIIHTAERPYQCKHYNCKNVSLHYSDIIGHLRVQNCKAISSINTTAPALPPSKPILIKTCMTYKQPPLQSFDSFEKQIHLHQGQFSQVKNTLALNLSQEQRTNHNLQQYQKHLFQEQNISPMPLKPLLPQSSNTQSSVQQLQRQLFLKEAIYQLPQGQLILVPQGTTPPLKLQLHGGGVSIQQPDVKSSLKLSQEKIIKTHVKSTLHLPHGQLRHQPHAQATSKSVTGPLLPSYKLSHDQQTIVQKVPSMGWPSDTKNVSSTSQTNKVRIGYNKIYKEKELHFEKTDLKQSHGQLLFGSTLSKMLQLSRFPNVQSTKIPEWLTSAPVTVKSCFKVSVPVKCLKRPVFAGSNNTPDIDTKQYVLRKIDSEICNRNKPICMDSNISTSKGINGFTNKTNEPILCTKMNSDINRKK